MFLEIQEEIPKSAGRQGDEALRSHHCNSGLQYITLYFCNHRTLYLSWNILPNLKGKAQLKSRYAAIKLAGSKTIVVSAAAAKNSLAQTCSNDIARSTGSSFSISTVTIAPFAKSTSEFRQELDGS